MITVLSFFLFYRHFKLMGNRQAQVEKVFHALDSDGDGVLSFEELEDWAQDELVSTSIVSKRRPRYFWPRLLSCLYSTVFGQQRI